MTPETLYERRWALTVIERVLAGVREDWRRHGREHVFDALRECLLGVQPAGGYAEAVARLGMSESAVHRVRRRFQADLRRLVAETHGHPLQPMIDYA